MREMNNYERLGSRKSRDSAEYFYRHKKTNKVWIMSHSLWANSPGETWMPLDGDCDELFQKWKNKESMQEHATKEYLDFSEVDTPSLIDGVVFKKLRAIDSRR